MARTLVPAAVAFAAFFAASLAVGPSVAQQGAVTGPDVGDEPIEIEASHSLEWLREQQAYVARGSAILRQGDFTVSAEILTAYYRESAQGKDEIWRMTAEGGVVIESGEQTARGDHGVYDVARQVFVLTGDDLVFENPQDRVTARDSLEYWRGEDMAVARGDAVAIRGQDRVEGDVLTAQFEMTPEGRREMTVLGAEGNVLVTNASDIATGNEGVYDVRTRLATLKGSVRINSGDNQLDGDYAEVDLETGVSRLLAQPDGDGRVRGLLIPGSQ